MKMGKPEYNDESMKLLHDELKSYVKVKYPNITWLDACNWAFYPLNPKHYLGVNFWGFLKDDTSMSDCLQRLLKDAVDKGTVADPVSLHGGRFYDSPTNFPQSRHAMTLRRNDNPHVIVK